MEILVSKKLDDADKENIPNWIQSIFYEHFKFMLGFYMS